MWLGREKGSNKWIVLQVEKLEEFLSRAGEGGREVVFTLAPVDSIQRLRKFREAKAQKAKMRAREYRKTNPLNDRFRSFNKRLFQWFGIRLTRQAWEACDKAGILRPRDGGSGYGRPYTPEDVRKMIRMEEEVQAGKRRNPK